MGYPAKTHYRDCREADPVNIIFTDVNINNMISYLRGINWLPLLPGSAKDLFLTPCSHKQDWQLVYGNMVVRYHLRLWRYSSNETVGNAHYELLSLTKGHVVVDHESAEKIVSNMLKQAARWNVADDAINLGNSQLHPFNNGLATHVSR